MGAAMSVRHASAPGMSPPALHHCYSMALSALGDSAQSDLPRSICPVGVGRVAYLLSSVVARRRRRWLRRNRTQPGGHWPPPGATSSPAKCSAGHADGSASRPVGGGNRAETSPLLFARRREQSELIRACQLASWRPSPQRVQRKAVGLHEVFCAVVVISLACDWLRLRCSG